MVTRRSLLWDNLFLCVIDKKERNMSNKLEAGESMTDKRNEEAERARLLAKFYLLKGPGTPRELVRHIAYELRAARNRLNVAYDAYKGDGNPNRDTEIERKTQMFRVAQHELWAATKMFELCMKERV
jgi:hypothetical protein